VHAIAKPKSAEYNAQRRNLKKKSTLTKVGQNITEQNKHLQIVCKISRNVKYYIRSSNEA